MYNPTHMIQHLAFGSIVLPSNGIRHGVCPHKQRVPVMRAGKTKSQVQSHTVPSFLWCVSVQWSRGKTALNATISSQSEGLRLEKGQDEGDRSSEFPRGHWSQLYSHMEHMVFSWFPKSTKPLQARLCSLPFESGSISHFFQTHLSHRKKKFYMF